MSVSRPAAFRALHERDSLFVMPNPWDVGSARLLESLGFEALATTSAGFAWSLGRLDQTVTRDELVAHVRDLTDATTVPLNVDSERCYPDDPGGITRTVELLGAAGAAGFSLEDYDPEAGCVEEFGLSVERVAEVVAANAALSDPMVVTARAENHIRGVDELDDTIARLVAYREAGADVVYAPGLFTIDQVRAIVDAAGVPVNVLALPGGPALDSLAAAGVRRISTGSCLASSAYGALVQAATELRDEGTSTYAGLNVARDVLRSAFGSP